MDGRESSDTKIPVRYIGTAASYTRGRYRWTKLKPVVFVTKETWAELKRVRLPHSNTRLFIINDEDDDDEVSQDTNDVRKARAMAQIGSFITKKDARGYVNDMFEVDFAAGVTLDMMNRLSSELQQRYDQGSRGDDLMDNLEGVIVFTPDENPKEAEIAQPDAGEMDTATKAVPKASRAVAKPGVRHIGG